MHSNTPVLRAINLSIAVLLLILILGAYWFVWRALPQTAGEITAPVSAQASIVRDSKGVPHITAKTWQDAIFLQGYATAQDRMWQMDAMRRLASGELSEVIGPTMLERDREARRLRLPQLAESQERKLTPEAREIYAAYAHGVNYYLETHRGKLPIEFSILRYEPRPWRSLDTILIGLHMSRTLTTSWPEEIRKLHMLQKGDRAKVEMLFPARLSTEAAPGSNAWAISGAHSTTGKPILAGDPHLEFSLPSTWHMVHLKAGDLDVTGAALPGVPAVIIGHNQRIAWSMTNLEYDVQDLYRERLDGSGRYIYRGQPQQAVIERGAINIKGQKPSEIVNLVTLHGPLSISDQNQSYALQWLVTGVDGVADFPFLALNQARNWEQFNAALQRFPGPPQNFVYADVDGNIGYHAAGQIPARKQGCRGDVPTDGRDGECDWQGIIPYNDLPSVYNPESGIIVSANQNPFPTDYKYEVSGVFAAPYRARQIRSRLESKPKWSAEQMLSIQKDVYSSLLHFLAQQAVKAAAAKPPKSDSSKQAIEELRKWNGQMEKGQAAPLIATLLYTELRRSMADQAAHGSGDEYAARMAGPALERLLKERPAGWFKDYDGWLMQSLTKAIEEGEKRQGSNIARWDYGQWVAHDIQHPILGGLPFIGKYFNVGPVPMSGSSTSVKQLTGKLGPSFRMIVDLANFDNSLANLTVGESGHFLSPHYKDQFDAYYNGTSFPMQFSNVKPEDTLIIKPF